MTLYSHLEARLAASGVVRLDGAVGTQLQSLGVPVDRPAWAATALETHPDTVRDLHRMAIEAGAEVITTNSYASARHNLAREGLEARTVELNRRAVTLAQEARDAMASNDPIYIAGSHIRVRYHGARGGRNPKPLPRQLWARGAERRRGQSEPA